MPKIKYTKELIEPIIKNSNSLKEVITKIGLPYCNGSVVTIRKAVIRYNISIEHFQSINFGSTKKKKYEEIFCKNSNVVQETLRRRVIRDNLIPYKCGVCNCDNKWLEKEMPLILDHINGINNYNIIENLRFLCPNCDSIQDTYKNKNKNVDVRRQKVKDKINKKILKIELKNNNRHILINKIKNNNINFLISGWRIEVGKLMNWVPQYAGIFVKKYIPEIWDICFKHKDRN